MRILRKSVGKDAVRVIGSGDCIQRSFDGYNFSACFIDQAGCEVHVRLERHEAKDFAVFIHAELAKQGERVRDATRLLNEIAGGAVESG